jgi:O-antigen ligase/tetratricopeptide (TPR) repeat protein
MPSRKQHATRPGSAFGETAVVGVLDRIVDGGLAAVLLFAPWFMGGRHPLGEFVYVLCCVSAASAWLLRQALSKQSLGWTWSGAEWLIGGALALTLLQILPLPTAVFNLLSAHSSEVLTLWGGSSDSGPSLGTWNQVSMAPAATWAGLTVFLAHATLLLVAVQRLRTIGDVQGLLSAIAVATVLMASVGLLQYLAGNGKFLWVYEHPHRDALGAVKGPFINKNHFAHMLALGIGALLWSLQRAMRPERRRVRDEFALSGSRSQPQLIVNLHLLGLAIVLFAGLMTLSRGGIAVLGLTSAICLAAYAKAGLLNRKLIAGTVGITILVGVALAIHGYQRVTERLDDYSSGSVAELDQDGARRAIWSADAAAVRDYPLLGTGVGTHVYTYPMYLQKAWPTIMTHAESGYLQIALETGFAGLFVLAGSIVLAGIWCWRSLRAESGEAYACAVAVVSGLTGSLIHSIWDFVWYIPACMSMTVLLLAAAFRLSRSRASEHRAAEAVGKQTRYFAWGAAAAVLVCSIWMAGNRFCAARAASHWDEYVKFVNRPDFKEGKMLADETIINHLEEVVRWTPGEAAPHLRLANECLRRFEREQSLSDNAIPLNQICEAALVSQFSSAEQLNAWLDRAVGPAKRFLDRALWHSHQALKATPLQEDGYIFLADLHFLEGSDSDAAADYVEQALRVRPYSARVLMAAGKQAALRGDFRRAIDCWRRSLSTDLDEQRQLVDLLVAFTYAAQSQLAEESEASAIEFIISQFKPELPLLRLLLAKLENVAEKEDLEYLRAHFVRVGEAAAAQMTEAEAVDLWHELSNVYHALDQDHKAVAVLRRAIAARPNDYAARFSVGVRLLDAQQYEEAQKHLQWCRVRKPDDAQLRDLLAGAIKRQVKRQSRARPMTSTKLR